MASDSAGERGTGDSSPAERSPAEGHTPDLRVSDRERDEMVTRVQVAFAEGRLDDGEFDTRVRAALAAKTRGELDRVVADLPRDSGSARSGLSGPVVGRSSTPVAAARKPGKLSLAYKTSLRRGGRWRVPRKFTAVSYKGGGTVIDLRGLEFPQPVQERLARVHRHAGRVRDHSKTHEDADD